MKLVKQVFDYGGVPILALAFIGLFFAESRSQLRKRKQERSKRIIINAIGSILAFTLLRFLFLPIMVKLAIKNQHFKFGLNYRYNANPIVKAIVAFLIMDYTNYLWHILNHKLPFLWRFHVVHHSDPDLDLSTALRFHFGEMIGSVFYRGAFVLVSGASALQVLLYEILFEGATQFHHSNWKLPYKLEKNLNKLIVTPRMHGIHHSIIKEETDSNYSVIFSFWDRMHNTARLNVNQDLIITGVPSYSNHDELTIAYLLKMPFTKIRPCNKEWEVRGNKSDLPDKGILAK